MIRDAEYLARWELDRIRSEPVDYARNLEIFEALYREAAELGKLSKDPLEGIETKIHMAKVLNGL
jgi:hypothetical protein